MKRKRFGLLASKKLTAKTIEKLERERARLLEGIRQNQAKVKEIDRILAGGGG